MESGDFQLSVLPSAVNPEPIGRATADGGLQFPVHLQHDILAGTWHAIDAGGDGFAAVNPPFCEACAVTNGGKQLRVITQGQGGGSETGMAIASHEGRMHPGATLIRKKSQNQAALVQFGLQSAAISPSFEENTTV